MDDDLVRRNFFQYISGFPDTKTEWSYTHTRIPYGIPYGIPYRIPYRTKRHEVEKDVFKIDKGKSGMKYIEETKASHWLPSRVVCCLSLFYCIVK
jgi:hypothetical protein